MTLFRRPGPSADGGRRLIWFGPTDGVLRRVGRTDSLFHYNLGRIVLCGHCHYIESCAGQGHLVGAAGYERAGVVGQVTTRPLTLTANPSAEMPHTPVLPVCTEISPDTFDMCVPSVACTV